MPRTRRHRLIGGLGLVAMLGALANCASPPAPTVPPPGAGAKPSAAPPVRNRVEAASARLRNTHAEAASPIDAAALATLYPAWTLRTDQPVGHAPVFDGGRVFIADAGGSVHALDRTTGRVLWAQRLPSGVTGGEAAEGRYYAVLADGQVAALDATNGTVLWRAAASAASGPVGTGAVRHFDGLLFVGLTDPRDGNGRVTALDAATGKRLWERPLAADDQKNLTASGSFAVDSQLDTVFLTTSEATGGAGGLSHSLVAIDARTGAPRWQRQLATGFRAGPQLFEASTGGQTRLLVGAGQPSGTYTALDRRDGQVVWQAAVADPGAGGGIVGEASFGGGRLFVWSSQAPAPGKPAKEPMVTVAALDAATGMPVWSQRAVQPAGVSAGFLTDGVYFVGSPDGRVRGYSAADGRQLWFSRDHGPVATAVMAEGPVLAFGVGVKPQAGASPGPTGIVGYRLGASPLPGVPASPTATATATPSATPSATPTPTPGPTGTPSDEPSDEPTDEPSDEPTEDPDEDEDEGDDEEN